ncbi:TPA: ATP-binding protein [Klebsiella variicola]|nr:ATP-binding protein [Klebsiella oxytoca]HCT5785401.1 ATP-binding protein [Klebsiella variicola]
MGGQFLVKKIKFNDRHVNVINEDLMLCNDNYFSIVVGKNGCGKSSLLEAIARGCLTLQALPNSERESSGEDECNIDYYTVKNDSLYKEIEMHFSFEGEGYIALTTHEDVRGNGMPMFTTKYKYLMPTEIPNVICISNGFFNRFPDFEKNFLCSRNNSEDKFSNLSLTQSFVTKPGRRLRGLLDESISHEIILAFFSLRLNNTLLFLRNFGVAGLVRVLIKPNRMLRGVGEKGIVNELELDNSLRDIGEFRQAKNSDEILPSLKVAIHDTFETLFSNIQLELRQIDIEREFNYICFPFSFLLNTAIDNDWGSDGAELAKNITLLSEYNIIQVEDVFLPKGWDDVRLKKMSSGELCVLLMLFKINSKIKDNSLILIDEPEISLHPAWQKEIIPSLEKCFSSYKGCHFIIATHSPQIVSGIPEENSCVVLLEEPGKVIKGKDVHGKSSDFQLFNTLNFAGDSNEYIIRELLLIISKIDTSQTLSDEDERFLMHAAHLLKDAEEYDTAKYLLLQAVALVEGRKNNGK